jgi:crotonobetainyl-CoA:carnitine CoA-transferase CaiB-like acyl-CoA transferase
MRVPEKSVFRTKDARYIGISASIQAMAERLFRAIGREDMITDSRFRTNTERVENAEACEAPIVAFIAARTLAENMEVFERAAVRAGDRPALCRRGERVPRLVEREAGIATREARMRSLAGG